MAGMAEKLIGARVYGTKLAPVLVPIDYRLRNTKFTFSLESSPVHVLSPVFAYILTLPAT